MDKRQTGLIATIAAAVLCGCPGFMAACWGLVTAATSQIFGAPAGAGGSSDPVIPLVTGAGSLCAGILLIAIPVAVWYFMLRKKPETVENIDEPVPPAS